MNPATLKQFKERLDELRSFLHTTIEQSVTAVAEGIQPPGEHESLPAEGVEVELAVERTEAKLLNEVQAALDRLEQGTFGRCIQCGVPIPQERIDALPYTAYCVKCERIQEQQS